MSLEHLKRLVEDYAQKGYIFKYSDADHTLGVLQEKIDNLTSGDKEKLRVIIEAELAKGWIMCITTKIHDEINADLAWAWRMWENEYVADKQWETEQRTKEPELQFWAYRYSISREVKKLILPRLETKASSQKPHQDRLEPLSEGLAQEA
jgi:hypothetical protein